MAAEPVFIGRREKERAGGPMLYIAGATLAIGIALFGYLRYTAAGPAEEIPLTPEAKDYVGNLHLTDVDIKATESYMKQTVVEIQGKISNSGERGIDTVEIYCIFRDPSGRIASRKRVAIVSARTGGLKPGDTKSFRLPFDDIPENWNQTMPLLVIAGVKFS